VTLQRVQAGAAARIPHSDHLRVRAPTPLRGAPRPRAPTASYPIYSGRVHNRLGRVPYQPRDAVLDPIHPTQSWCATETENERHRRVHPTLTYGVLQDVTCAVGGEIPDTQFAVHPARCRQR
jgi:hypothetical protein